MKRIILFCLILFLFFLIIPNSAKAATFRASKDGAETISAQESVKNLYAAGSTVNSDAKIQGDMIAAGSTLNIDGSVEQSLIAAGSIINLKAVVGQNAKLAGGTINIDSKINQDLSAAGGTITITDSSLIIGDLMLAGGTITFDGTVNGNVWVAANDLIINGTINGNVVVRNVMNLKIGSGGVINGNLTYYSPNNADIASGAIIKGTTDHQVISNNQSGFSINKGRVAGLISAFSLGTLIMSFLLLLVLVYLFPKSTKSFTEKSFAALWPNVGWGFVTMVVVPVAVIILFTTILGAFVGLSLLGIYIFVLGLAKILSIVLAGAMIIKWANKGEIRVDWLTALIGVLVVFVLDIIPVLGWFALFLLMLIAVGQITRNAFDLIKAER